MSEKLSPDGWYDLILEMTEDKKLATEWYSQKWAEERYAGETGPK